MEQQKTNPTIVLPATSMNVPTSSAQQQLIVVTAATSPTQTNPRASPSSVRLMKKKALGFSLTAASSGSFTSNSNLPLTSSPSSCQVLSSQFSTSTGTTATITQATSNLPQQQHQQQASSLGQAKSNNSNNNSNRKLKMYCEIIEKKNGHWHTSQSVLKENKYPRKQPILYMLLEMLVIYIQNIVSYVRLIFTILSQSTLCESFAAFLIKSTTQVLSLGNTIASSVSMMSTSTNASSASSTAFSSSCASVLTMQQQNQPTTTTSSTSTFYKKQKYQNINNTECEEENQQEQNRILNVGLEESLKMYEDHAYNLVLDLDETLVHCNDQALNHEAVPLSVRFQESERSFYMHERPYLQQFLREVAQSYNVYIFTASQREYAEEILRCIDGSAVVKQIYSRSSCFFDGKQINKDLSSLGFDLSRTLFVDNSPACVANNAKNAIRIKDFYRDLQDSELKRLANWLKRIVKQNPNMQEVIAQQQQLQATRQQISVSTN